MAKAIRGHNLWVMATTALLAAALLLVAGVFAVRLASTAGERVGTPAMSKDSAGESSLTRDPAIERHAEIVARHNQGNVR